MMKKGLYAIIAALTVFALVMTGCETDSSDKDTNKYTITFDGNGSDGGAAPTAITQTKPGEEIPVPGNTGSLTKTNFDFAGWNTKADGKGVTYPAGEKIKPTADTTLYAKWSATIPFTVTFDANGGGDDNAPKAIKQSEPNEAITLPGQGRMAKDDSIFAGWGTTAAGYATLADYEDYTPDGDVTLYAI